MMESITIIFHQQKFIMFTLLFMWCRLINVSCNTIHRNQIKYNHFQEELETNNILSQTGQAANSFKIIPDIFNIHKNDILKIDSIKNNSDDNLHLQKLNSNEGLNILKIFLLKYVKTTLSNTFTELLAGKKSDMNHNNKNFNNFKNQLYQFIDKNESQTSYKARSIETGRLFLYKGLKNVLWPLFIGVQIAKSILVALFLPSILGSLGIMVGKRLPSLSSYPHHRKPLVDSDFPDTVFPLDDQYKNPRPEASENHDYRQPLPFQPLMANLQNENHLHKLVENEKFQFNEIGSKNNFFETNKNMFQSFLKIPSTSLLLSNYDPFYSPLLSRIDSVFSQFKIEKNKEDCRSKLICFMYANPNKYAPYSNLVSAQLSRELNELQKPINDNPEILRFFKYMQAAKSGQDGKNCAELYKNCSDLKDSETPIMITTFNDINKLVEAKRFII